MKIYFYAKLERIQSIHQGNIGVVVTKESRGKGFIQVSFDLDEYDITVSAGSPYVFIVERKNN